MIIASDNMVSRLETLLDHTSILSLGAPKSFRATGLLLRICAIIGQAIPCALGHNQEIQDSGLHAWGAWGHSSAWEDFIV